MSFLVGYCLAVPCHRSVQLDVQLLLCMVWLRVTVASGMFWMMLSPLVAVVMSYKTG